MEIVFEKYQKLIQQTAWKCSQRAASNGVVIDAADIYQDMCEWFLVLRQKFDATKGFAFSTYLVTALYRNFNRWVEKEINQKKIIGSLEEIEKHASRGEDDLSLYDVIDSDVPSPEDKIVALYSAKAGLKSLSRRSKEVVRIITKPTDDEMKRFGYYREQQLMGRKLGLRQIRELEADELTISFALDVVVGSERKYRKDKVKVKQEISKAFGITL